VNYNNDVVFWQGIFDPAAGQSNEYYVLPQQCPAKIADKRHRIPALVRRASEVPHCEATKYSFDCPGRQWLRLDFTGYGGASATALHRFPFLS
jgi:hypothetical protein